jgi:excisionase family DNA binding protein
MTTRNAIDSQRVTRYLSIPEAAVYLGVRERFVRRLVETRRIPYTKMNRLVRFDEADLAAFAAAGRVEPWDAA